MADNDTQDAEQETPLQRRVLEREGRRVTRAHEVKEELEAFRRAQHRREEARTYDTNSSYDITDNPYTFREGESGVDAVLMKQLKDAGGYFTDKSNFKELKLKGKHGVVDLPKLVGDVAERLETCGVAFLGACAANFAEFRKHARTNDERRVKWTKKQAAALDQLWAPELRDLVRRHSTAFPRLESLLSDEAISAADRVFSVYLDSIIQDQGGAQMRAACAAATEFLALTKLDVTKGWTVAADRIEAVLQRARQSKLSIEDMFNNKVVQLLPETFVHTHCDYMEAEQGKGWEFGLELCSQLRKAGRVSDGREAAQAQDVDMQPPLQHENTKARVLLTQEQFDALDPIKRAPTEAWNNMSRKQRADYKNKQTAARAQAQRGAGAEAEQPSAAWCSHCEHNSHNTKDCRLKYSNNNNAVANAITGADQDAGQDAAPPDPNDVGLGGFEDSDWEIEENLGRIESANCTAELSDGRMIHCEMECELGGYLIPRFSD